MCIGYLQMKEGKMPDAEYIFSRYKKMEQCIDSVRYRKYLYLLRKTPWVLSHSVICDSLDVAESSTYQEVEVSNQD
ncbi:hypothetical protein ACS0TY_019309 [Phlomoides rotata]